MPKVSSKEASVAFIRYQVEFPNDRDTTQDILTSWLEIDEGAFNRYVKNNPSSKPTHNLRDFKIKAPRGILPSRASILATKNNLTHNQTIFFRGVNGYSVIDWSNALETGKYEQISSMGGLHFFKREINGSKYQFWVDSSSNDFGDIYSNQHIDLLVLFFDAFNEMTEHSENRIRHLSNITRESNPDTPIILIRLLSRDNNKNIVTLQQGQKIAKEIGAINFFSSCAETAENIDVVYQHIIKYCSVGPRLYVAAKNGKIADVAELFNLDDKVDVNQQYEDGLAAADVAAIRGHFDVVNFLLTKNADPNKICSILLDLPELRKKFIICFLRFFVEEYQKINNNTSFLTILAAKHMFMDVKFEEVEQSFLTIKDDLFLLKIWFDYSLGIPSIHEGVSDMLLKHIKRQQLQQQHNDAYFISSSLELRKQLKELVTPNLLQTHKTLALNHVQPLVKKGNKVDNLISLLDSCLEPHMFLNSYRPGRFFGPTREKFLLDRLASIIKEISSTITKCQGLSHYVDVCNDLIAIRDVYISYKDKIINLCNTGPTSESEQNLKLMYEPRYILGFSSSMDYACEGLSRHLTPTKVGETDCLGRETEFGTHIVREYGGIHFKYHMKGSECFPAVEYMVGSLYNMLAGASYGIAPTEIVKLYPPFNGVGKPKDPQIFVASQSVKGINLDHFLSRHARHHPEYLQKFDLYSFSTMVITSLLSNPADGKADNYMVSFIPNENGNTDENDFRVKIIGIDNDLSFANTRIKKHGEKRAGQHFIEVQSIFYFFPQMEEKISSKLINELLNKSVEILLIGFIKSLQIQNENYKQLKEDGLLTESEWSELRLPICFHKKESLVFIYNKLLAIQCYINKNPDSNHSMLFENIYPEMFAYYKKIHGYKLESTTAAMAILEKLDILRAASAPSLEEAKIIMSGKDRRLASKIAFATMNKEAYLDRYYSLSEAVEEFIKAIDFASIPSIELQRTILVNLTKLDLLEGLTLLNCQGLDDGLLIDLTTSLTKLKSIHLVGCNNVTIEGVLTAYNTCTSVNKPCFGVARCQKITAKEYKRIADMQLPLKLLAKDFKNEYYGFAWNGDANTLFHRLLSNTVNLSLSIEQMRFLILSGLDIDSDNNTPTDLNGYTALHVATVNSNLKMLSILLALGANPHKIDKNSKETPFQKAAKRKLFMPCYLLSKVTVMNENVKKEKLRNLAAVTIQKRYRALKHNI